VRSHSSLNPEGRHVHGKQQYTLVLGEQLKTTATEAVEMLLLGFFLLLLWEPLGVRSIQYLQIKPLRPSVGY